MHGWVKVDAVKEITITSIGISWRAFEAPMFHTLTKIVFSHFDKIILIWENWGKLSVFFSKFSWFLSVHGYCQWYDELCKGKQANTGTKLAKILESHWSISGVSQKSPEPGPIRVELLSWMNRWVKVQQYTIHSTVLGHEKWVSCAKYMLGREEPPQNPNLLSWEFLHGCGWVVPWVSWCLNLNKNSSHWRFFG